MAIALHLSASIFDKKKHKNGARCNVKGDRLVFAVENSKPEQVAEHQKRGTGMGLKNVKRRLELLYPRRHHLEIEERTGVFKVRLEVAP